MKTIEKGFTYVVGSVIGIDGERITVLMNQQTNYERFHINGIFYNGVAVGSYVGIIRGGNKIVARVDREYSEDLLKNPNEKVYLKDRFKRLMELSIIGNFHGDIFEFGRRIFPLIFNDVVLLKETEIRQILTKNLIEPSKSISIGHSVFENISIDLDWTRLFNTHIGIFGNTGSGKSNTLARLYTNLFDLCSQNKIKLSGISQFYFIDFNGEYIGDKIFSNSEDEKYNIELSTGKNSKDKLIIPEAEFWNVETLSIFYEATEKTQKPFLQNTINYFWDDENKTIGTKNLIEGMGSAFYNVFNQNNNKDSLSLLIECINIIFKNNREIIENPSTLSIWLSCSWNSKYTTYYYKENGKDEYINNKKENTLGERKAFEAQLESNKDLFDSLDVTNRLLIALYCQMIFALCFNRTQLEFINPLLSRVKSHSKWINKIIEFDNEDKWKLINIISLRNCNQSAKKMVPLLLCRFLYDFHKQEQFDKSEITHTKHLIVDEAHNILSEMSTREASAWKDYRLEVFEEIIKEGRKFGFYLTLASQRPSDISATIISQIHNTFIHRLVNEQDLRTISSSISSLDVVSKGQIPLLAAGQCIISGTSFDMPVLIQIDKLDFDKSPKSESANLSALWSLN